MKTGGINMIKDKIKEVIADQLDVKIEEVTDEARLVQDLGADSLDLTELVMTLEDETGVEIDDDKAKELVTLGKIIEFLKQKNAIAV